MGLVFVLLCNKIEIENDKPYRSVKQNYTNKSKTMKKVHRRKSPQGDGEWATYSKYFIMVFTMLEVDANGPYRYGSKDLQVFRKRQDQEW